MCIRDRGSTELAAVSLGNSLIFVAMSIGIGFSTALTPIIGEADAEKDNNKIRSAFHHGMLLCTILGFALFGMVVFAKPIMEMLHQPKEVIELAKPYLDWVAFSLVPLIIYPVSYTHLDVYKRQQFLLPFLNTFCKCDTA